MWFLIFRGDSSHFVESAAPSAQPFRATRNHSLGWTSFEPIVFSMSDAVADAFHSVLSRLVQRLCLELQAAALAYGYLDPERTVIPFRLARERQSSCFGASARTVPGGVQASITLPAQYSCVGSTTHLNVEAMARSSATAPWLHGHAGIPIVCAAGIASLSAGGAAVLFSRCSFLQSVVALLVVATVSILVCCMVAWVLLELTVYHSFRRLYQLLANMQLQHKLAKEVGR